MKSGVSTILAEKLGLSVSPLMARCLPHAFCHFQLVVVSPLRSFTGLGPARRARASLESAVRDRPEFGVHTELEKTGKKMAACFSASFPETADWGLAIRECPGDTTQPKHYRI